MNRFQHLDHLFHQALDRPPSERVDFLRSQCPGDEALMREVLEMLEIADEETLADRQFRDIVAGGARLPKGSVPAGSGQGREAWAIPAKDSPSPSQVARRQREHLVHSARQIMMEPLEVDTRHLRREAEAILALDTLLNDLKDTPSVVEVLELCYFAELSPYSAAFIVGVNLKDAQRWYRVSRAFWIRRLGPLTLHPDRPRGSGPPPAEA